MGHLRTRLSCTPRGVPTPTGLRGPHSPQLARGRGSAWAQPRLDGASSPPALPGAAVGGHPVACGWCLMRETRQGHGALTPPAGKAPIRSGGGRGGGGVLRTPDRHGVRRHVNRVPSGGQSAAPSSSPGLPPPLPSLTPACLSLSSLEVRGGGLRHRKLSGHHMRPRRVFAHRPQPEAPRNGTVLT